MKTTCNYLNPLRSQHRDHSEELAHDLAEARKKRKKGCESPKTPPGSPSHQPPPPPPPAGPSETSGAPRASGSQVTPPPHPSTSTNQDQCHKLLTDSMDDPILRHNVSKPLPLGGPPGQVTIQSDFFFNKDLEYLRYGSKGWRPALSISKMKAAYYPDAGLEQMVPDQQRFYIDRHTSEGDRSTVRTHMRILSVVRIEVFSMYGYDYMKKIVLHRADLNEHVIAERDFNDGNLQQIVEALDYRVKEFRINRMNPGLNTRFWTRKDVDRCNAFMFTIQRRLRTRRIFRNLESFVGGRVREGDYKLLMRTD
nr:hypothetical protein [Tanacetum cinerariifolium]